MSLVATLTLVAAALVAVIFFLRRREPEPAQPATVTPTAATGKAIAASAPKVIPFTTEAIEAVRGECWKLAFKVGRRSRTRSGKPVLLSNPSRDVPEPRTCGNRCFYNDDCRS